LVIITRTLNYLSASTSYRFPN